MQPPYLQTDNPKNTPSSKGYRRKNSRQRRSRGRGDRGSERCNSTPAAARELLYLPREKLSSASLSSFLQRNGGTFRCRDYPSSYIPQYRVPPPAWWYPS